MVPKTMFGSAGQQKPWAAFAADKTSAASAAGKAAIAATSATASDISMESTTPRGGAPPAPPHSVVDDIWMSDVAADVAAVAAFLAADTADVLSAAKPASGESCPANSGFQAKALPKTAHAGQAAFYVFL